MTVVILLFNDFETLDAFGPAEILGKLKERFDLKYVSLSGGIITSAQNIKVVTEKIGELTGIDIVLIPGGMGTRQEVNNREMIKSIREISINAKYVLSVCTGSALLAKTGLLKGRRATSNKRAFQWVTEQDKEVLWQKKARWIKSDKFYTSSGVSAGMDMTLGFISDILGKDLAEKISDSIEYIWSSDPNDDKFSVS